MNVILEGPDNSGKSTLAEYLQESIYWPVKDGEGPPKSRSDLMDRVDRYMNMKRYILDRHPVISELIYGMTLRGECRVPDRYVYEFYNQPNLVIYCRNVERGLHGHQPSLFDTEEHTAQLEEGYGRVLRAYDAWAKTRAHIWYTSYHQMPLVLALVQGFIHKEDKRWT